jgi:O-antigen/teichoic acid export membrane protein
LASLIQTQLGVNRRHGPQIAFMRSVARGFSWTMLAAAGSQAASLAANIIAARLLGRTSFGVFGAIQTTALSLTNIAAAGLGITATQYLARTARTDTRRAGRLAGLISLVTLFTAGVISLALLILAPRLTTRFAAGTGMEDGLRIAAIYVFFATLSGYQMGSLVGLQAFRALTVGAGIQTIVLPAAMYGLGNRFGVSGTVLALGVSAFSVWVVQFLLLRSEFAGLGIRLSYSGLFEERRIFSHFALPAACSGVVGNLAIWGGTWILLNARTGLAEYALFSAAYSLRTLVLFVPSIVNRVAVPVFAGLYGSSAAGYRDSFRASVQISVMVALAVSVLVVLIRGPLLGLFGKSFNSAGPVALLLAAACMEVASGALFQALLSRGAIWTHVGVTCVWSIVLLATASLLVGRIGCAGLAAAYCAAWSVSMATYAWFAARSVFRRSGATQ